MTAEDPIVDGRHLRAALSLVADLVVVGSGPAGAAAARAAARTGAKVLVIEEGHPATYVEARGLRAMAALYRDLGTSVAFGAAPLPFLQGRAVGGTSVINGAICWRLPEDAWQAWVARAPMVADALPFAAIADEEAETEARLGVAPTDPAVAGRKNLLLAAGATALGLAHRPIRRNVGACLGAGRCLQGCPHGAKHSVDRNLLLDALDAGATLLHGVRVDRLILERGRAAGVVGRVAPDGVRIRVRAGKVILAASAIQTPLLLRRSGLRAGDGLMAHPGVSVSGRFPEPVYPLRGATQGHEVTGLRHEGLKIEALGFDEAILVSRLPGAGADLAARIAEVDHWAVWGAAVKAQARGTVHAWGERAIVRYALTTEDLARARRGVRILGELFFAAGATEVATGLAGLPVLRDPAGLAAVDAVPLRAGTFPMSMTHLFATAAMGEVVGADFQHREAPGVYVADSSLFPSNTGVNPQITIMAVATLCAKAATR